MVPALGLLQPVQVVVEIGLRGPGGPVDAGQHRVVRIAPPIGARDLHQLEGGADLGRRGHVRAAAEVEPVALAVDLQILARRDRVDQLDLEGLLLVGEQRAHVLALPDLLGEGRIARNDLAHLRLDLREVLGRERRLAEEVVVESVLDHRADGHLRVRPERLHGLGQHVRAIVADQLERARVGAVEELDARVAVDRIVQVGHRAVQRHGDGALGQRLGDTLDHAAAGGAGGDLARVAVGEGEDRHGWFSRLSPAYAAGKRLQGE